MPAHKYTIEDMRERAEKKGGKCLSEIYISCKSYLKWQCSEGHQWEATSSYVQRGLWCPHCRGVTIEALRELAESKGGCCLSKQYIDCSTKLKWECHKKHRWETTQTAIKTGYWCPECAREAMLLTLEEMHDLARKKGGKCLSNKYTNTTNKLKWECGKGHQWMTTPAKVKRGCWCPKCARLAYTLTIDEMRDIAKSKGGKCLSSCYVNNKTRLLWECEKKHQWLAVPKGIKKGYWCLECYLLSRKKDKPEVEHNTITRTLKLKLMSVPKEAKALKRRLEKNDIYIG